MPALPGEAPAETEARRSDAYFAWQVEENKDWLARMGRDFDVRGKRVLDLGCGHGALSVLMAELGASEVVGIDLEANTINYANRNVATRYPALARSVRFETINIAELEGQYDLVVSKDTFEHVADLQTALDHVYRLLAPGGMLASGFSPLYFSPFGDHGRFHLGGIPWLHAVVPEVFLAKRASRYEGRIVRSAADVGLNKLTKPEFERYIGHQPWNNVEIRCNQGLKRLFELFNILRRFPPFEKYFTVNIYMSARK